MRARRQGGAGLGWEASEVVRAHGGQGGWHGWACWDGKEGEGRGDLVADAHHAFSVDQNLVHAAVGLDAQAIRFHQPPRQRVDHALLRPSQHSNTPHGTEHGAAHSALGPQRASETGQRAHMLPDLCADYRLHGWGGHTPACARPTCWYHCGAEVTRRGPEWNVS